jgi:hypothetical protein
MEIDSCSTGKWNCRSGEGGAVIPVGMEFLLGSPANATVLNVGIPFGAGLDYMLTPTVSVGLDWRSISAPS